MSQTTGLTDSTETSQPVPEARWYEDRADLDLPLMASVWHNGGGSVTGGASTADLPADPLQELNRTMTSMGQDLSQEALDRQSRSFQAHREARRRLLEPGSRPAARLDDVFHGVVIEVLDDSFAAEVSNGADAGDPPVVMEFSRDGLTADDQEILVPGAAFHVTVGTDWSRPGGPVKVTAVRMQRFRSWPQHEIDEAMNEAEDLASWLKDVAEH